MNKKKLLHMSFIGLALLIFQQGLKAQALTGFAILKGTQNFGLTVSLGAKNAENQDQFIQYVNQLKKNSWAISAEGGYTFADYLNSGLRISIAQSLEKSLITPLNGTPGEVNSFARSYTIAPYLRNYIPLGSSNIIYLCNRVEFLYSYESKIKETLSQDILTRQHTTSNTIGLGLRPGMLIMIQKGFGFELSLNILGFNYVTEKSTTTDLPVTKVSTADIDLKIDVLKLNLGFYYYF